MTYLCPICQLSLSQHQTSKGYFCANKHHFDLAKEGYLNLLPVQHKKSKQPGDSRAMMRARRNFLQAGYYQPMAQALSEIIDSQAQYCKELRILDMGCGEGYYCRQIELLSANCDKLKLHGTDIAKNAILAAAKKQPTARYIVASNKRLPYQNAYFDMLLRVCAPTEDTEVRRLLKNGGLILLVTPGARHLWQLKEFIYQRVREHQIAVSLPHGFEIIDQVRVTHRICPDTEQRLALLQMTPFAWRANGAVRNKIQRAHELEIEVAFEITLAKLEDKT